MPKFTNAYYVTLTLDGKPFFVGPYDVLEEAEKGYVSCGKEHDLQIVRMQVIK